jgi:uncharacterized membrane protein YhaH (DUF805 family)
MLEAFNKFTSTEGRLSRKGYFQLFLLPLAGMIAFTWLVFVGAPDMFGAIPSMLFLGPWLVLIVTTDAQNIKRWHDLGNSGAIYRMARPFAVVLPIIAMIFQFFLPSFMAMSGDLGALMFLVGQDLGGVSFGLVPTALLGITLAAIVFNIGYLAAVPGRSGPNEFGPDPLASGNVPGVLPGSAAPAKAENDDPVKRALAAYQAEQKRRTAPVTAPARPDLPSGSFGRKRV